jgi:hypothetical protein
MGRMAGGDLAAYVAVVEVDQPVLTHVNVMVNGKVPHGHPIIGLLVKILWSL